MVANRLAPLTRLPRLLPRSLGILTVVVVVLTLTATPAGAITGGVPDAGAHPYVGMVYNDEYLCSGTLISPTVFLTAGHCTALFEAGGSQVYVTFAEEADFDPATAVTGTPYTHPSFCLGCGSGLPGFDAYDVGIVVLDTPVTDVGFGVLPAPGTVDTLEKGTRLTAVGYGVRGFERGGGPPQPVGIADRYRADPKFINITNVNGEMFIKHSGSKGGTCFGDSGGPIFAPDQVTVLGVTSFGTNGVCAGVGYAQRIDRPDILAWIAGFLG